MCSHGEAPVLQLWGVQDPACLPKYLPYSPLEDSTSFAPGMWGLSIVMAGLLSCVSAYIQAVVSKKLSAGA